MIENIIIVDENDVEQGFIEKMEAHENAILHRAFSIFVFNENNEMLLHQRASSKYHSPSLWTNTCCSHPNFGETLEDAVHRRLKQEMGFDCDLKEIFSFLYKAELEYNLVEHEFDHVFIGKFNGDITPNKDEVEDYKWISISDLQKDISEHPENYTIWFKTCVDKVIEFLNS